MTHIELDSHISELERMRHAADADPRLWKDVWDRIKQIGSSFKSCRYPTHSEHQAAWGRFQDLVSEVKHAQEQHRLEGKKHEQVIRQKLDRLSSALESYGSTNIDWKETWARFSEVRQLLQNNSISSKTARDELWQRLKDLNDRARANSETQKREWESRAHKSSLRKEEIIARARAARPLSEFENSIADMVLAPIRALVDVATLGLLAQQIDERRGELLACSDNMRKAWALFQQYKEDMLGKDKHEAFSLLQEVQSDLNSAWDAWKGANGRLHESKQAAYEAKHATFVERVTGNIEKLEDRLDRLSAVLEHKESHLADLREKYDTAWNDDFRERVGGWIDEEENAIGEIKSKIAQLESWIEEEKAKLR